MTDTYPDECAKYALLQVNSSKHFKQLKDAGSGLYVGEVKILKDGEQINAYEWRGLAWEKRLANWYAGDSVFEPGVYDHLYDIRIAGKDSEVKRLPYNEQWSFEETASLFCARENIPTEKHIPQIVNFLKSKIKPKSVPQRKAPSNIPMRTFLYFDSVSIMGPQKKLCEFRPETDADTLNALCQSLSTLTQPTEKCLLLLKQLLTSMEMSKVFPAVDLFRIFLLNDASYTDFTKATGNPLKPLLTFLAAKDAPNAVHLLSLRCLCNLFKNCSFVATK